MVGGMGTVGGMGMVGGMGTVGGMGMVGEMGTVGGMGIVGWMGMVGVVEWSGAGSGPPEITQRQNSNFLFTKNVTRHANCLLR